MSETKKLTGYPSIDKPWLKYYSEEARNAQIPEYSMFDYIYIRNKDYPNDIAISYYGRKITYKKLFELIDRCAGCLSAIGIKRGDIVTVQTITIPQVIILMYALNKIGACGNMIYPTVKPAEIREIMNETNSQVFFVLDNIFSTYEQDFETDICNKIILFNPLDEMGLCAKLFSYSKVKYTASNVHLTTISWVDFMKTGEQPYCQSHDGHLPAFMVYTGGTTGKSKAVVLSSFNINSVVEQYRWSDIEFIRGKSNLNYAPPFVALGINVGIHLPLSMGISTIITLDVSTEETCKSFLKIKPNYFMTGTACVKNIISKNQHSVDMSFIDVLAIGGDSISVSLENNINQFLESNKCKVKMIKGYGMSETSGTIITETTKYHKTGSVGIPLPLTNVKIINPDTNEELVQGCEGEICVNTPSMMVGYYNFGDEKIVKRHDDGMLWIHTGDIGVIDNDGFVTIIGRIKRIIALVCEGTYHKLFPKLLEEQFLSVDGLSEISIVGRDHPVSQKELVAFVVPKSGVEIVQLEENLRSFAEKALQTYERPSEYRFVKELPKTLIGKINFRALEKMAEEQMNAQ